VGAGLSREPFAVVGAGLSRKPFAVVGAGLSRKLLLRQLPKTRGI